MHDLHVAASNRSTRVQVRHFSHLLGMVYEAHTINASHGWIRKYPMEAHDLLPQLYYRGAQEHGPAYCRYYPAGRGTEFVTAFHSISPVWYFLCLCGMQPDQN